MFGLSVNPQNKRQIKIIFGLVGPPLAMTDPTPIHPYALETKI